MSTTAPEDWAAVDLDRIEAVSSSMDLRRPNREALESIVWMSWHHFASGHSAPFEGVVDSATGVGKTYIIAAALDYLAGEGIRNFAVICPGRTILNKTVENFTANSSRSLLAGMDVAPVVVTAENFDTPAMRAQMDDEDVVKLYLFTVQSLLRPTTKAGKKVHKFQEGWALPSTHGCRTRPTSSSSPTRRTPTGARPSRRPCASCTPSCRLG